MDRRVFQPQSANSLAHRRSALGMAVAVLLAGGIALYCLNHAAPPGKVTPQKVSSPNQTQRL